MTEKPSAPSLSAIARPIPEVAPVTTATGYPFSACTLTVLPIQVAGITIPVGLPR